MGFFSTLFGGPSKQQIGLAAREDTLASTMAANYNQQFGAQSEILKSLTGQLTPIANLGPNAQGYSPEELAAMNTQAINVSGAAVRNAQQATAGVLAGRGGGGTSGIVSGIEAQIKGSLASAGAQELAGAQNEITQRNYQTGRENFWAATHGEHALAGLYNPAEYGKLAGTETSEALSSENQIQAMRRASLMGPISLGRKALGVGLTGGMSLLAGKVPFMSTSPASPASGGIDSSLLAGKVPFMSTSPASPASGGIDSSLLGGGGGFDVLGA
jgi:hypothetical protein